MRAWILAAATVAIGTTACAQSGGLTRPGATQQDMADDSALCGSQSYREVTAGMSQEQRNAFSQAARVLGSPERRRVEEAGQKCLEARGWRKS